VKSLTLGSKQLASLFDCLVEGFLVCDRDMTLNFPLILPNIIWSIPFCNSECLLWNSYYCQNFPRLCTSPYGHWYSTWSIYT